MRTLLKPMKMIALLFAVLLSAGAAGMAQAEIVFRGMITDNGNPPHPEANVPNVNGPLGNPKNYLNVQTNHNNPANNDITPVNGNVSPQANGVYKGMSVSPVTGCNLPAHRRPNQGTWNGTNTTPGFVIWQFDTDNLPDTLQYHPDPGPNPTHGVISPAAQMTTAAYLAALAGTANDWTPAPAPANNCP